MSFLEEKESAAFRQRLRSTEEEVAARAQRRVELIKEALNILNHYYSSGAFFVRTDIFKGIDRKHKMYNLACNFLARVKSEKFVKNHGSDFSPSYKAVKPFKISEEMIVDYAATTYKKYRNSATQIPDSDTVPSGPPSLLVDAPSPEEALQAFFAIIPALVEAIQRIERRLIDMDSKVSRIYSDLTGK